VSSGKGKRRGLLALCLSGALVFAALGAWQIQRLNWKRDLIARVDQRVHASPVAAPAPGEWPALNAREVEYRRVQAHGVLLHDHETLVDALTALGPGAWVVTPLRTADGVILVNRGFVPPALREPGARISGQLTGEVTITGLLRLPEPGGRMLRNNQPAADRWFSRDVAAIGRARGLQDVAPFFIDADATSMPGAPAGGMTVIRFRNQHLSYAATWFALAALCIFGLIMIRRPETGE
jgi:surfeit locus 1 family protein